LAFVNILLETISLKPFLRQHKKLAFLNGKYRDVKGYHALELLSNVCISQRFKLRNSPAFIFCLFAHQHYLTTNVTPLNI